MKKGLVLMNMQNDYFKDGVMEIEGMDDIASRAKVLLEKFRQYQLDVFHIQQINKDRNSGYLLSGTNGVVINDSVRPKNAEKVIKKHFPNSFKDTELLTLIQKRSIDHLVFCGAMVHSSIDSTVRAAYDFGFKCTVIDDACASTELFYRDEMITAKDVHSVFMAGLSDSFAEILSLEEFLRI